MVDNPIPEHRNNAKIFKDTAIIFVLGVIALGYAWFNPSDESTLAGVVSRLTFALAAIGLLCVQSTSDERALVFDVLRAARRRLGLAA